MPWRFKQCPRARQGEINRLAVWWPAPAAAGIAAARVHMPGAVTAAISRGRGSTRADSQSEPPASGPGRAASGGDAAARISVPRSPPGSRPATRSIGLRAGPWAQSGSAIEALRRRRTCARRRPAAILDEPAPEQRPDQDQGRQGDARAGRWPAGSTASDQAAEGQDPKRRAPTMRRDLGAAERAARPRQQRCRLAAPSSSTIIGAGSVDRHAKCRRAHAAAPATPRPR